MRNFVCLGIVALLLVAATAQAKPVLTGTARDNFDVASAEATDVNVAILARSADFSSFNIAAGETFEFYNNGTPGGIHGIMIANILSTKKSTLAGTLISNRSNLGVDGNYGGHVVLLNKKGFAVNSGFKFYGLSLTMSTMDLVGFTSKLPTAMADAKNNNTVKVAFANGATAFHVELADKVYLGPAPGGAPFVFGNMAISAKGAISAPNMNFGGTHMEHIYAIAPAGQNVKLGNVNINDNGKSWKTEFVVSGANVSVKNITAANANVALTATKNVTIGSYTGTATDVLTVSGKSFKATGAMNSDGEVAVKVTKKFSVAKNSKVGDFTLNGVKYALQNSTAKAFTSCCNLAKSIQKGIDKGWLVDLTPPPTTPTL